MPRLNEKIHVALKDSVLQILHKKGIYTVLEFIQVDPEVLVKITGLHYTTVLQIRDNILSKFSSSKTNGFACYQEVMSHCAIVPTGIKNLDQLLGSGLVTGNIYELCGGAGSGKTQICKTITVHICKALSQHNVLYIDTKYDFSTHRIVEMEESKSESNEAIGALLEKIKVCQIRNSYELLAFLHKISKDISESEYKTLGLKLIIIDSLAAIFYQLLGDRQSESLCLLNNITNILHYIAVEYDVVILVTNLVTSWTSNNFSDNANENEDLSQGSQTTQQPSLGKYWAHIPNTRINVKKINNTECLLTIVKSTDQPIGKTVKVSITNAGVQ